MAVFKKRESLIENITYMALMAAINVVFVLLTFFVPFLLFLLVFILPLSSTIVATYCKKRYYVLYAIATIGICILVTIGNFGDTIFFVIPSIITGFLFGWLIDKKIPPIIIITGAVIIQVLLTYPGLWLANQVLYPGKNDVFKTVATTIGIGGHPYFEYVKNLVIVFIALTQQIISFIVIKEESNKIGISIETKEWAEKLLPSIFVVFLSLMSLVVSFFAKEFAYTFMVGSTLFAIYLIANLVLLKKTWINLSLLGVFLLGILIFAAAYSYIQEPLGFLLIQIIYCLVAIIVLINNYLLTHINKR